MFVSSQGSAQPVATRGRARRAVDQAEMAARDLGRLSLMDALSLVTCYADVRDGRGAVARAAGT